MALDLRKRIKTHEDGTSHDAHLSKQQGYPGGPGWCQICLGTFGPAVDQEFVAKLRPGIARFLQYGHDDNH